MYLPAMEPLILINWEKTLLMFWLLLAEALEDLARALVAEEEVPGVLF